MTKAKKAIITGLITASLGLGGYTGYDTIVKTAKCLNKPVKIEHKKNYYCGTESNFTKDYGDFKTRLVQNKLKGKADVGFGQLIIRNKKKERDEIIDVFKSKYNAEDKIFIGSKFDGDVINQMTLLTDIADFKCNNRCVLTGSNINEKIYNLIK